MASAHDKRNAKARALGYRNWYDYRMHGYGRIPPGEPKLKGEQAAVARGARGGKQLQRDIASGKVEMIALFPTGARDSQGQWREAELVVVTSDGKQRTYMLRGSQLSHRNLARLKRLIDDAGITADVGYLDHFLGGAQAQAA